MHLNQPIRPSGRRVVPALPPLPALPALLVLLLTWALLGCRQSAVVETIPPLIAEAPPPAARDSLGALIAAEPPERDLVALATALKGVDVVPVVVAPAAVGERRQFWYLDGALTNRQVMADLLWQTPHFNFWFEDGARIDMRAVEETGATLESDIMPRLREFFGEPESGVGGDARINLLHLRNLGGGEGNTVVAGYFSAADRYPVSVNPYSNERNMLYLSLDSGRLDSDGYYQTLAHELQHAIHAAVDSNETAWVDEGLAELAAYVSGYNDVASVDSYAALTDVQLNAWVQGTNEDIAHYGASFLFSAYFLEQYGEEAMRALVRHPENGFAGYRATLDEVRPGVSTDDLFGDWLVANYVASLGRNQPPWGYELVDVPRLTLAGDHSSLPASAQGAVYQYGADYIRVRGDRPLLLEFEGSQQVSLLPTQPNSGDYFVTTYPADRSDMTLTRRFDLTAAPATTTTLSFWTWYQIEAGWDYGYILASADDGATWEMLPTIFSTRADPRGNNLGVALTGQSRGNQNLASAEPLWTEITVDLTPYVGREILLRFQYVTDEAVYEAGWAIDDIALPAIGYREDFEQGLGGWELAGWVHHTNVLPQEYLLQVIYVSNDDVRVERLTLDAARRGRFELNLDPRYSELVLTVSGRTPVTQQRAAYRYTLSPQD